MRKSTIAGIALLSASAFALITIFAGAYAHDYYDALTVPQFQVLCAFDVVVMCVTAICAWIYQA